MTRAERIKHISELIANATPGEWNALIGAYPTDIAAGERVDGRFRLTAGIAALKPGTTLHDARMMAWGKGSCEFLLEELDRADKVVEAARAVLADEDALSPVYRESVAALELALKEHG